jgi:hypothetical protein
MNPDIFGAAIRACKPPFIWGMTAEEVTAIFTLALVIVGALTAIVFICQSILLRNQVKTAREEFISTHRPKIRIRYVVSPNPIIGQQPTAEIHAANIGETSAVLKEIGVDIFTRIKGKPNSGLFNAIPKEFSDVLTVPPGKEANMQTIGGSCLTEDHVAGILQGTIELCLLGIINYVDGNNVARSTSFFRIYNPNSLRFVCTAENDEYAEWNYED